MAPLDKTIPRLSGLDGEGSVQVHQDPDMKIEGAKVFPYTERAALANQRQVPICQLPFLN